MSSRPRKLATLVASAIAALLVLAASSLAVLPDDEDSPWPDTEAVRPNLAAVQEVTAELVAEIELMELSAARYADWEDCLRGVPISEYGDPDGQAGYLYDEVDGTGVGFMPALAVDRRSRPRKEDYLFFDFERGNDCRTNAPKPGGTAESASLRPGANGRRRPHRRSASRDGVRRRLSASSSRVRRSSEGGRRRGRLDMTLRRLERRVAAMKRAAARLEDSSERFDEWESCVSSVPVTEYGDPDGKFGYLYSPGPGMALGYRPALAIDRSDWEDPEYVFLAFVGGDRPGRFCQDEPGEAVD